MSQQKCFQYVKHITTSNPFIYHHVYNYLIYNEKSYMQQTCKLILFHYKWTYIKPKLRFDSPAGNVCIENIHYKEPSICIKTCLLQSLTMILQWNIAK